MNYIKKLEARVDQLEREKAGALEQVVELLSYLSLPKFHVDTTVQVSDIHSRLDEARMILLPSQPEN